MNGRARGDRGAVLVEFALVATMMTVLLFGVIEFGLAWQDRNVVETSARAGARVASGLGKDRLADWNALQSVKSAINDIGISNVDYVVIFNSLTADGVMPPECNTSPPTSQSGKCNVYTGAQLSSLTQSSFQGANSCTGSSPDIAWCPTSRQNVQSAGTDYVGVYITAKHNMITRMFGTTMTLTTSAVMRIEPIPT